MKSISIKPVKINGVNIYPFSSKEHLLESVDNGILVAVNAEKILNASEDTQSIINRNIGYADGVGAVWALNKKGFPKVIKIPGCELWLDIISKFENDKSFYFVGGTEKVINSVMSKLNIDYPNLNVLGYRDGYLTEQQQTALILNIQNLKPDIVFVAMGSPRQEILMQKMQLAHPAALYQGLGGSFDVYTEKVKRAPKIWIDLGLEWAYRWIKEPRLRTQRNLRLFTFFYKLNLNKF